MVYPEDLQPLTWALTVPLALIVTAGCFVRFWSRAFISRQFGVDDWAMVFAWIVWSVDQACLWIIIAAGGGKPQDDVDADAMTDITTWLFIVEFVYTVTQFLIKMSFLLFYLRVLATTKGYRQAVWIVIGINIFQTVAILMLYGLQCIPIDAYFNPTLYDHPFCMSTGLTLYLPAGANVAVDIIIYLLPLYPLWNLHMSLKRRLELIACFTLGGGAVLVSLLRFIVLHQLAGGKEASYVYGSVVIITTIEFATAIMTANAPALQVVWKKYVTNNLSESDTGYGPTHPHELGTVGTGLRSRKRGSVMLRSRDDSKGFGDGASEEELCRDNNNIVVNTRVDVTSVKQGDADDSPKNYYNFTNARTSAEP